MLGSADGAVARLRAVFSGEKELETANQRLSSVRKTLDALAVGNTAVATAARENARSHQALARDVTAASGGLLGLQSQIISTRAAQEALNNSTANLSDTFDQLDAKGTEKALGAITDQIAGAMSDQDTPLGDDLQQWMDQNLSTQEIEGIVRYLGQVDQYQSDIADNTTGDIFDSDVDPERYATLLERFDTWSNEDVDFQAPDPSDFRDIVDMSDEARQSLGAFGDRDFDITVDEFEQLSDSLMEIGRVGDQENILDGILGASDAQLDQPLDPTAYDVGDHPIDPHIMHDLFQYDDLDTLGDVMEKDASVIASRMDIAPLGSHGMGEFGTLASAPGSLDPDGELGPDLVEQMQDVGIENMHQLFSFTDEELQSRIDQMDGMFSDVYSEAPNFRDAIHGHFAQAPEWSGSAQLDPDAQGVSTNEASRLKDSISDFGDPRQSIANELTGVAEEGTPLDALRQLQSRNENIAQLLDQASSADELRQLAGGMAPQQDAILAHQLQNNPQEIASSLDFSGAADNIQNIDTIDGFQREIGNLFQDDLTGIQQEVLANTAANMDDVLPGDFAGENVPLSYEGLEMGLMQQMMDTEDGERRQAIQGLLGQLQTGRLDDDNEMLSLLHSRNLMGESFMPMMDRQLPDHFSSEHADIISGAFRDQDMPITHFLGDDSPGNVSDVVTDAIGGMTGNIDSSEPITEATEAAEQSLEMMLEDVGSQIAPGMYTAMDGTDDTRYTDLLPGSDVLESSGLDPDDPGFSKDLGISHDRKDAMDKHISNLGSTFSDLQQVQENAPVLRQMSGQTAFGGRRQNRGLFGVLRQRIPQAIGAADNAINQSPLFNNRNLNRPENIRRISWALEGASTKFEELKPLLEITSLRLGSANVNFESFGIMLFKLTAMMGPLIAGLIGLAGAALTAAAAFGSFIAVGAVEYLSEMEDTMAGVNDKQEAMQELGSRIKDMAWEAVSPLTNVTLDDGRGGMSLFVDTIRNAMLLLNRFATIMAGIVEMPVVSEQLERVHALLFDMSGDSNLAENLQYATQRALPTLVDLLEVAGGGLGTLAMFTADLTRRFGDNLIPMVNELGPAFQIMISYGAGFFEVALTAIGLLARIIGWATAGLDGFLDFLPFVNAEVNTFAMTLGGVVGGLEVFSRVATYSVAKLNYLAAGFRFAYGGAKNLASALRILASAKGITAAATFKLTVAVSGLAVSAWLLYEGLAALIPGLESYKIELSTTEGIIASVIGAMMGLVFAARTLAIANSMLATVQGAQLLASLAEVGGTIGTVTEHSITLYDKTLKLYGVMKARLVPVLATVTKYMKAYGVATAVAAAKTLALFGALVLVRDAIAYVVPGMDPLVANFDSFGEALGGFAIGATIAAAALHSLGSSIASYFAGGRIAQFVARWGLRAKAMKAAKVAAVALVTALKAVAGAVSLPALVVGGLVVGLIDLVYWAYTGESAIEGILRALGRIPIIGGVFDWMANGVERFYNGLARVRDMLINISSQIPKELLNPTGAAFNFMSGMSVPGTSNAFGSGPGMMATGTVTQAATQSGGSTSQTTRSSSENYDIDINVDSSRSDRDLSRFIQREFDRYIGRHLR